MMRQNNLQVALIQADLCWENPAQNRLNFSTKIKAISELVDVIVLPEMFNTGFTKNIALAETMDGETLSWMKAMANEKQSAIVGSIIIEVNNCFYNRLLFVYPDGQVVYYDKHYLFTLSGENEVFTAGKTLQIIQYKGWKICPLICYDLRFPEWSRNTADYDVLLYVASWPKKRVTAWDTLLQARAIENMSYTIGVNRVGVDGNGYAYSGHTNAFDALGESLVNSTPNTESVTTVTLQFDKQMLTRNTLGFLKDIKNS